MNRKEEIIQLIKHLLNEVKIEMDIKSYSNDFSVIIECCEIIAKNSALIQKYMNELNELKLNKSQSK